MRQLVLGFLGLGLLSTFPLPAAELIETPNGVLVRAVLDWENAAGLEVRDAGRVLPAQAQGGVADYTFSAQALCEGAAYREVPAASLAAAATPAPWTSLGDYCLPDRPSAMSFLFIADSQQHQDEHRLTGLLVDRLRQENPGVRFVLNDGDLVEMGLQSEWKKYRETSTSAYSDRLPLVPAVGNHEFYLDFGLANWKRLYATPETQRHYYTLEYPLFSLIVLDSNIGWMSNAAIRAEDRWLETELERLQGARPILVAFHHPGYTSGHMQYLIPVPPAHVREVWQPLFEKYQVKAVLNGHEHIYERLNVHGIEHILAGPAGGHLSKPWIRSPYSEILRPGIRTVSLVTLDNAGHARVQTWSVEDGKLFDDASF
jgi:hypothetical protein